MSDPAITPFALVCPKCFDAVADEMNTHCEYHFGGRFGDQQHTIKREAAFSRDALVRAVAATLDYYSGVPAEQIGAEAEEIVARLTTRTVGDHRV